MPASEVGGAAFVGIVDAVEDVGDLGPVRWTVDAVEPVVAACVVRDEDVDEGGGAGLRRYC